MNEEQDKKIQELEAERMRQARIRKALKRQELKIKMQEENELLE